MKFRRNLEKPIYGVHESEEQRRGKDYEQR